MFLSPSFDYESNINEVTLTFSGKPGVDIENIKAVVKIPNSKGKIGKIPIKIDIPEGLTLVDYKPRFVKISRKREKVNEKTFGTDGIRGKCQSIPNDGGNGDEFRKAVTYYFQKTNKNLEGKPLIILGKDTRLSCYMLELAFSSGVCSQGGKVILTGPLPTPGVSFVTSNMRAHAGVMISASHNHYEDNGIKIFDGQGNKLPDSIESEIEKMVLDPRLIKAAPGKELGRAERLDEVIGRYIVQVKSCLDPSISLEGLRIILDCANGAGYKVAPMIFSELGGDVFTLGTSPNGQNINLNVGSLHPQQAALDVTKFKAEIGVCLDGDADRVVIIDEKGEIIPGDILIGILSKFALETGIIHKGEEVVGTIMSNLALEKYIERLGLSFIEPQ